MSKKTTIGHGPILETAKRIVERTVFYKNVKCLLSDCFIHIYRIVHLLRRDHNFCLTFYHSLNILTSKIIP